MIHVITTKNKTYQIQRKKTIMKAPQSKNVQQQSNKDGANNGGGKAADKELRTDTLKNAVAEVRAAIGRLSERLEAAAEADKPAIKAELEALMKSVCLEIDPATVTDKAPAADAAESTIDATGAEAPADKPADEKKGVLNWVRNNKLKTFAIVAGVATVAAGVVYAVRSGKIDAVKEQADVLMQKASDAMSGVFGDKAAETVAEATVEATAEVTTEAAPSFTDKLANGLDTVGGYLKDGWNTTVKYAIGAKDAVVGLFSSNASAAEAAANAAEGAVVGANVSAAMDMAA